MVADDTHSLTPDKPPIKTVSWVSSPSKNTDPSNQKFGRRIKKRNIASKGSGRQISSSKSKGNKAEYNLPLLFHNVNDVLFNAENIPDRITGSYQDDYDILHIHEIVLCKLEYEKKELPSLYNKRKEITTKLATKLKIVQRNKLQSELDRVETRIKNLEKDTIKKQYLEKTSHLIEEYKRLGPVVKVKSFLDSESTGDHGDLSTEETPSEDGDSAEHRLDLIKEYLGIAGDYIPINVVRIIPNDRRCPGCGQDLTLVDPEDYSFERCEECGVERQNFSKPSFFKETSNQGKSVSNSDYEDEENFIKAFECFLGEQQPPPDDLFRALDNWAFRYNHPSKEEIKQLPLNEDGTRGDYGKSMLLQALADEGYAEYYKDFKLIGHLQWGWELPTVTQQQREIIYRDYRETQKIFNRIKKDRKSSINAQIRLYRHFEARGIPCRQSDFKLPTTSSILDESDAYWKEMVKAIRNAEYTSLK